MKDFGRFIHSFSARFLSSDFLFISNSFLVYYIPAIETTKTHGFSHPTHAIRIFCIIHKYIYFFTRKKYVTININIHIYFFTRKKIHASYLYIPTFLLASWRSRDATDLLIIIGILETFDEKCTQVVFGDHSSRWRIKCNSVLGFWCLWREKFVRFLKKLMFRHLSL